MLLMTLILAGCNDGSLDLDAQAFALSFDSYGCAGIPLPASARTPQLTLEMQVLGATDRRDGHMPLAYWEGVFLLVELDDGNGWFGDEALESGAAYPSGFVDEAVHHVAVTLNDEGRATLFVDGLITSFGQIPIDGTPGDTLKLGCWPAERAGFQGVIDEVRLSSGLRYTSDFEPDFLPFDADGQTTGLWHMNEGAGDAIADLVGGHNGWLEDVGWVAFDGGEL